MIIFEPINDYGGRYTEDYLRACFTSPWTDVRVRHFSGKSDWLVIDAVYVNDGNRVWYIYERISDDNWAYRSFGDKA